MPEPGTAAPPKGGGGKIAGMSPGVALLAVGIGVLLVFMLLSRPKTSNAAQAGDSSSTPAPDLTGVGDVLTQLNATVAQVAASEQDFQAQLTAYFTQVSAATGAAGTDQSVVGQACGQAVPKGKPGNACPSGYSCKHGKCQLGAPVASTAAA